MGPRRKYQLQKYDANKRGILWQFNYPIWLKIWYKSGHWKDRGCRRGQYVMARFGDKGPYAPENVRICTVEENRAEAIQVFGPEVRKRMSLAQTGRKHSLATRRKMSESQKGRTASDETRAKMSAAKKGKPGPRLGAKLSDITKDRISASKTGKPGHKHTEASKQKISVALQRAWKKKRTNLR